MNFEEFLTPKNEIAPQENKEENNVDVIENELADAPDEIDVQKVVVEELAADKAALDEQLASKKEEIISKESTISELMDRLEKAETELKEVASLRTKNAELERKICELQEREIDMQERNPNALALLDRDTELPDKFPGETRDHVLEVLRDARNAAEKEGRLRRAQILESVLVANEPNGNLAKKRAEMERLFNENGNILSGPVLDALKSMDIPHKVGEEYLLPAEIIKRTF